MPLYDVEHFDPLSEEQQAALAVAFTNLHASRFKTPKFFVNVRYTDVSGQVVYRGGKKVQYNRVILRTRVGEQRSKDLYDDHCRDIINIWADVVGEGQNRGLRTVWVLGALTTAVECGIARPKVGEEAQWLQGNIEEFRKLAEEGDTDFVELLQEIEHT